MPPIIQVLRATRQTHDSTTLQRCYIACSSCWRTIELLATQCLVFGKSQIYLQFVPESYLVYINYIYPTVFFTASGDKRDFFYTKLFLSLSRYPFNETKKKLQGNGQQWLARKEAPWIRGGEQQQTIIERTKWLQPDVNIKHTPLTLFILTRYERRLAECCYQWMLLKTLFQLLPFILLLMWSQRHALDSHATRPAPDLPQLIIYKKLYEQIVKVRTEPLVQHVSVSAYSFVCLCALPCNVETYVLTPDLGCKLSTYSAVLTSYNNDVL